MTEVGFPVDLEQGSRLNLLLALAFLAVVAGGITDLVLDAPAELLTLHVLLEVLLTGMSLGLAIFLWRRWQAASASLVEARRSLEERRAEQDAWRRSAQSLLEGLGRAIDGQFAKWQLTPAERDVALQLLKGGSHKEIASATHRSERTVRQHAVAVYRKAGLSGRAELAAFFLEDLMLPSGSAAAGERAPAGPAPGDPAAPRS